MGLFSKIIGAIKKPIDVADDVIETIESIPGVEIPGPIDELIEVTDDLLDAWEEDEGND